MSVISANLCNQNRPEDHHFIFPHQQSSTFLLISLSVSYSCCFKYNLSTSRASVIGVGAVKAAVVLQRQQLKEKKETKRICTSWWMMGVHPYIDRSSSMRGTLGCCHLQ